MGTRGRLLLVQYDGLAPASKLPYTAKLGRPLRWPQLMVRTAWTQSYDI
jgi:hypothetical protein